MKKDENIVIQCPIIKQRPTGKKVEKINYSAMFAIIVKELRPWINNLDPKLDNFDAVRTTDINVAGDTLHLEYRVNRDFRDTYLSRVQY